MEGLSPPTPPVAPLSSLPIHPYPPSPVSSSHRRVGDSTYRFLNAHLSRAVCDTWHAGGPAGGPNRADRRAAKKVLPPNTATPPRPFCNPPPCPHPTVCTTSAVLGNPEPSGLRLSPCASSLPHCTHAHHTPASRVHRTFPALHCTRSDVHWACGARSPAPYALHSSHCSTRSSRPAAHPRCTRTSQKKAKPKGGGGGFG